MAVDEQLTARQRKVFERLRAPAGPAEIEAFGATSSAWHVRHELEQIRDELDGLSRRLSACLESLNAQVSEPADVASS